MSKKISELTAANALTGSEEVPLTQDGATKKVTVNDLLPVQLQGDRTIDLNGKLFDIKNGAGSSALHISPADGETSINSPSGNKFIQVSDDADRAIIEYDVNTNIALNSLGATYKAINHIFPDLVAKDFADDAAAATGLVPVAGWYHTSGTLKIRIT